MSNRRSKAFPCPIEPTRANTGNPSGNAFRDGFRNDEEFIKWIESCKLSLTRRNEQLEIKLKIAEKLIADLGGANDELRESAKAFVLCSTE